MNTLEHPIPKTQPARARSSKASAPATFFPVFSINSSDASMRLGTTNKLVKPGGVLEHIVNVLESRQMFASLELHAYDIAVLREENPALLERLQHSQNLSALSATFTNFQPFLMPELFSEQLAYGKAALAGFKNLAPVGSIPSDALNHLYGVSDAEHLLHQHEWDFILFEKLRHAKAEFYQPQGIKQTAIVDLSHQFSTSEGIRGIVASKTLRELYADLFLSGQDADSVVANIIEASHKRKDRLVVARHELEYAARSASGLGQFDSYLDALARATDANSLRIRRFDAEAVEEVHSYFDRETPKFHFEKVNYRFHEEQDEWAPRLRRAYEDARQHAGGECPPAVVRSVLLGLEHEYRRADAAMKDRHYAQDHAIREQDAALLVTEALWLTYAAERGIDLRKVDGSLQNGARRRLHRLAKLGHDE